MPNNALRTRKQQLRRLREAIHFKPPFCSGTISVESEDLDIFYGSGDRTGLINASTASDEQLAKFSELCTPATFGMDNKDVLDETYRKAGKMDATEFLPRLNVQNSGLISEVCSHLLEGHEAQRDVIAELYKLNVYGPGSFFKPHKDTPRGMNMFGSLVVVYPTRHDGGALVFREGENEWAFDSAREVSGDRSRVAYAAFFSDVDHEVTLMNSGYRITVTYNLYFSGIRERSSPSDRTKVFRSELADLLQDSRFLPRGGWLGFGLRHIYPIASRFNGLHSLEYRLKGSDEDIRAAALDLSLVVDVRMLYQGENLICQSTPEIPSHSDEWEEQGYRSLADYLRVEGDGDFIPWVQVNPHWPQRDRDAQSMGLEMDEEQSDGSDVEGEDATDQHDETDSDSKQRKSQDSAYALRPVWVTLPSEMTFLKDPVVHFGNECSLEYVYGHAVLLVHVPRFGDRATSPSA